MCCKVHTPVAATCVSIMKFIVQLLDQPVHVFVSNPFNQPSTGINEQTPEIGYYNWLPAVFPLETGVSGGIVGRVATGNVAYAGCGGRDDLGFLRRSACSWKRFPRLCECPRPFETILPCFMCLV